MKPKGMLWRRVFPWVRAAGAAVQPVRGTTGRQHRTQPERHRALPWISSLKGFYLFALTFVGCLRDLKKAPPSQSGKKKKKKFDSGAVMGPTCQVS